MREETMRNKVLAEEVLSKYCKAIDNIDTKQIDYISLCQIEMAKALENYPLSVAEYIQKNRLVNFNALEYIGVVRDYQ